MGIGIPLGFITPSQNRPNFAFSVVLINLRGIGIPKGIKVKSEKMINSNNYLSDFKPNFQWVLEVEKIDQKVKGLTHGFRQFADHFQSIPTSSKDGR